MLTTASSGKKKTTNENVADEIQYFPVTANANALTGCSHFLMVVRASRSETHETDGQNKRPAASSLTQRSCCKRHRDAFKDPSDGPHPSERGGGGCV